jgi:histidyl-tRNA synthetase
VERLVLLKGAPQTGPRIDCFLAALGTEAERQAFVLLNRLQRDGLQVEADFEGKSLKAQLRRAGKLGARFAAILGEAELAAGQIQLRDMDSGSQEGYPLTTFAQQLRSLLKPVAGG